VATLITLILVPNPLQSLRSRPPDRSRDGLTAYDLQDNPAIMIAFPPASEEQPVLSAILIQERVNMREDGIAPGKIFGNKMRATAIQR
jgi:hypothetical protein